MLPPLPQPLFHDPSPPSDADIMYGGPHQSVQSHNGKGSASRRVESRLRQSATLTRCVQFDRNEAPTRTLPIFWRCAVFLVPLLLLLSHFQVSSKSFYPRLDLRLSPSSEVLTHFGAAAAALLPFFSPQGRLAEDGRPGPN